MDIQEYIQKMKATVDDPRMISGIYNWCDRWCERCAFTERCTNFQMQPQTASDINFQEFWDEMGMVFAASVEMLREMIEERGIDLSTMEITEEDEQREKEKDRIARNNPCVLQGKAYDKQVQAWLEALDQKEPLGVELRMEDERLKDCLEIVQWYRHFIFIKLQRAHKALEDEKDWEIDPLDSLGTAKVALIAIDRSIGAWSYVLQKFGEDEDLLLHMLAGLQRLRRAVEEKFPAARAFVRPGLDE